MVEIVVGIVRHANFFHHAPRAPVRRHGEGHDFVESKPFKAERQSRLRALGGIASPPMLGRQSPADFDAGREVRLEWRITQTDEPRKGRNTGNFDCPQAEAMFSEVRLDSSYS